MMAQPNLYQAFMKKFLNGEVHFPTAITTRAFIAVLESLNWERRSLHQDGDQFVRFVKRGPILEYSMTFCIPNELDYVYSLDEIEERCAGIAKVSGLTPEHVTRLLFQAQFKIDAAEGGN